MVIKKIILLIEGIMLSIVLSSIVCAAITMDINVKQSFVFGDSINFDYIINSDVQQEIVYIADVSCPEAPKSMLFPFIKVVWPNSPIKEKYEYIVVTNNIEPQECTAYIKILSPVEQIFEKNFTIITNPSMVFKTLTCKDSSCENEAKIFYLGEDIYFKYVSEPSNPVISGHVTYPDGTVQDISIPSSIKASQIGTYELNIIVSKDGYKTLNQNIQFGVIEKPAEIATIAPRPIEEYSAEKMKSEAQGEKSKNIVSQNKIVILFFIVIIGLIAVVIVSYLIVKRRKNFDSA